MTSPFSVAACRVMAFELAQVQEEVYVLAERHRGQTVSTRKSFPGGSGNKPLDVIGKYCETAFWECIADKRIYDS